MKPARYRCTKCRAPIEPMRAAAALSRGREPTYCSSRCKNAAAAARNRAKPAAPNAVPLPPAAPAASIISVSTLVERLAAAMGKTLD